MSAAATAAGWLYAASRLSAKVRGRVVNQHQLDVLATRISFERRIPLDEAMELAKRRLEQGLLAA